MGLPELTENRIFGCMYTETFLYFYGEKTNDGWGGGAGWGGGGGRGVMGW